MAMVAQSRPFLGYYNSEEEDSSLRSISPHPASTPGESDSEASSYVHYSPHDPSHTRPAGHGTGGTLPPSLCIDTNANATPTCAVSASVDALRQSLDALPDWRLREIIANVASSSPRFQRAIQKELELYFVVGGNGSRQDLRAEREERKSVVMATPKRKASQNTLQTPPITPTTPRSSAHFALAPSMPVEEEDTFPRRGRQRRGRGYRLGKDEDPTTQKSRRHRRSEGIMSSRRVSACMQKQSFSDGDRQRAGVTNNAVGARHVADDEHYHPGYLRDEAYEFVSQTPDGAAYRVVRNITMWSCCDEDEMSRGCVRSFFAASQARILVPTPEPVRSQRPVTPDSLGSHSRQVSLGLGIPVEDLIDQDDNFPVFGVSGLSDLDTLQSISNVEDVYPDSDLESPYATPLSPGWSP